MIKSALKATTILAFLALGSVTALAEDKSSGEVALFLTIKTQPGQRDALVALWDKHLKTRAAENADHLS